MGIKVAVRPNADGAGRALAQGLVLTLVILLIEAGAGLAAHSLALLADAGHMLADVSALGLAWFALAQSRRPADDRRTYGYHRVGILAALANTVVLVLVVAWVALEAVQRLQHPVAVQGRLMLGAATLAVAANAYIAFRLHRAHADLGVRAAALHVLGDLAASVGVVLAAIVILATGWLYADPLISLAVAALIAWGAVRICLEIVQILLEGTPRGLDTAQLRREIEAWPGVTGAHDLHAWSLSDQQVALSCHVVVDEGLTAAQGEHLVRELESRVCDRFGIGHTTIQVEACHPCDEGDVHAPGAHNHPHTAGVGQR